MDRIDEQIKGFFHERIKCLRPISPMAAIMAMTKDASQNKEINMYRHFSHLESRVFNIKGTINASLSKMGTEENRPLIEHLFPPIFR